MSQYRIAVKLLGLGACAAGRERAALTPFPFRRERRFASSERSPTALSLKVAYRFSLDE